MKRKINLFDRNVIPVWIVFLVLTLFGSCSDLNEFEDGSFKIFYTGVTDIGPSMSFNLEKPTYIGDAPSEFAITKVKLSDQTVQVSSFLIDSETGAISINNTESLEVGVYYLTVSCVSNGKSYTFEDVVTINMMRPVPDGITVEPEILEIPLDVLLNGDDDIPTAQVKTDGDHISIRKYIISSIRKNNQIYKNEGLFKISSEGEISIEPSFDNIEPGRYIIDLKLTTAAIDEESEIGIFADALVVNITSKPLSVNYMPSNSRVEFGSGVKSSTPTIVASEEDLNYSINSVIPASFANDFSIDQTSGVITLAENNSIPIGTNCLISLTISNKFGTADFNDVYSIDVVAFINPIEKFSYDDNNEFSQAIAFNIAPEAIDGDEVTFELVGLSETLKDLKVNEHTGEVYAEKGNSIPVGNHSVKILAKNIKSEVNTTVNITIKKNPYYFTYFRWGNNLGLSPSSDYASQHRVFSDDELLSLSIPVTDSDIPEDIEMNWRVKSSSFPGGSVDIDNEGTITFSKGWSDSKAFVIVVEATAGKDLPEETVVTVPLFIHCSQEVNGAQVDYTPFVLKVNPRTGGRSVAPEVSGSVDLNKFILDYRRNFQFFNVNGPEAHINGQPSNNESFMYNIWKAYYTAIGSPSVNTGARGPMSYIDNKDRTSVPAGYVNNTDYSVIINPDKWKDDNAYANGVFIGQMTFATDGVEGSVGNGTQIFPLAVWFDTKF